jgi:hypothetical protein
MERIQFKKEYKLVKGGSERADLIKQFLDRINPIRREGGFGEITPSRMGMLLSHIPTDELYAFYKMCDTYKGPFCKCFFGALKVKR